MSPAADTRSPAVESRRLIVDCHAHLLPPARMEKLIRWTRRQINAAHPVADAESLESLLHEYTEAGVTRLWNFAHAIFPEETEALNAWNWRLGRDHPQIMPFGTCHPLTPDPRAVVDRCLGEYGFIGMKFHPFVQRFVPWEERFFPIWERIAEHGRIVVFHTGFEDFYGGALPLRGFEAILRAVPGLLVVFAHANYPNVAEAFEFIARYPNVYVDAVNVLADLTRTMVPRADRDVALAQFREGVERFPDRVLFGTDHPAWMGTLAGMYGEVHAFGLSPDLERRLLGENAWRLMECVRGRP